jgi:hypothetical protein
VFVNMSVASATPGNAACNVVCVCEHDNIVVPVTHHLMN